MKLAAHMDVASVMVSISRRGRVSCHEFLCRVPHVASRNMDLAQPWGSLSSWRSPRALLQSASMQHTPVALGLSWSYVPTDCRAGCGAEQEELVDGVYAVRLAQAVLVGHCRSA